MRILSILSSMLVVTLSAVLPVGCAGPRYYGGMVLPDGHITAQARQRLLEMLPEKIKGGGAARVEVAYPGGSVRVFDREASASGESPDLVNVPTPALVALHLGLDASTRGSELDLWVPLEDERRVAVTVLHEPDGTVLVQQGSPRDPGAWMDSSVTPQDLKSRYGIAPSDFGEATWTPAHYAALELALGLLTAEERALVSHVPIVREHKPLIHFARAKRQEHVAAMYTRRLGAPRIELYDSLLSDDEKLFCGSPDAPLPRSVLSILHEFGHVVADAASADAVRDAFSSIGSYASLEDYLKAMRPGPREGTFMVTPDERAALEEQWARTQASIDRADRLNGSGPVLWAYRWARKYTNGPTPYGRTSLDESFAESFAMFHADPAALRRVDSKSYEWFERAGHIRAIAD